MDDSTLAFTFLGLLVDDVAPSPASSTETGAVAARLAAFEVAQRWMPEEILAGAVEALAEDW